MNRKHLVLLFLFSVSTYFSGYTLAQCSKESITAKYWQYLKNLKHFIAVDRDPSGCIHDGIGQSSSDPCICSKAGYGLPAISINMENEAKFGMGEDRYKPESAFYDPECGGQTGPTNNYLDMGSETPHQMGWYWVVLATEWKLLKENHQEAEAQRTLEELVLGLQAYRRLDITANCLARNRYREITHGFETGAQCEGQACLCSGKYKGTSQWNFDVGCGTSCGTYYTPRTDGYSGFFLREDATQALEPLLHDPSEGKWNIDLIGGNCYSTSLSPPCTTTFSQTCYLAHRQGFMSQDGVSG